ncbi:hypothetical protein N9Q75_01045 [Gammaproteobacteria bacterium]|jgi:hypothetical protein|nr:hypothetical protein [Gammaproteobacteria bacterium]|tara:strand:- start:137 stop:664 length:528 start_codon:yes stop_codon:yes gene_type:complete
MKNVTKIFVLLSLSINSIALDDNSIKIIDIFDGKKSIVNSSRNLNIKLLIGNKASLSSDNIKLAKTLSIKDGLNYKSKAEELMFQNEISSIPKEMYFIIHLNSKNQVYSIQNLGDIFTISRSHTRENENDGHVHHRTSEAIINISPNLILINNSLIVSRKTSNDFVNLSSVTFIQ